MSEDLFVFSIKVIATIYGLVAIICLREIVASVRDCIKKVRS